MQVRERVPVESELLAEPEAIQVQPEPLAPVWGEHGTLWQWLVVIAVSAIVLVLFAQTTFDRAERLGSAAFPEWYWRIYDWKVWPLSYFR